MFMEELKGLFNENSKYIKNIPILSDISDIKSMRRLSYDTLDTSKYEEKLLNNINSSLYHCQTLSSRETNSTDFNSIQSIISQNLEMSHQCLKIMVLGDKNVGKSLLINKIINQERISGFNICPTKSYLIFYF